MCLIKQQNIQTENTEGLVARPAGTRLESKTNKSSKGKWGIQSPKIQFQSQTKCWNDDAKGQQQTDTETEKQGLNTQLIRHSWSKWSSKRGRKMTKTGHKVKTHDGGSRFESKAGNVQINPKTVTNNFIYFIYFRHLVL